MENYFHKLHNENPIKGVGLDNKSLTSDVLFCCRITEVGIKNSSKKMRVENSAEPNDIPIEV